MCDENSLRLSRRTRSVNHISQVICRYTAGHVFLVARANLVIFLVHTDDARKLLRLLWCEVACSQQQLHPRVLEHQPKPLRWVIGSERHVCAPGLEYAEQAYEHLYRRLDEEGDPNFGPNAEFP